MRISSYPFVVVRVGCNKCSRRGLYRLARLADKYGSEMTLMQLLDHLAGDCKLRDSRRPGINVCGAHFVDLGSPRPPDLPAAVRPKLRAVK